MKRLLISAAMVGCALQAQEEDYLKKFRQAQKIVDESCARRQAHWGLTALSIGLGILAGGCLASIISSEGSLEIILGAIGGGCLAPIILGSAKGQWNGSSAEGKIAREAQNYFMQRQANTDPKNPELEKEFEQAYARYKERLGSEIDGRLKNMGVDLSPKA